MKSGRTLVELATEIQNQAQSKRDYIADTRTLELTDAGELVIDIDEPQALSVTEHTHSQIGDRVGIPPKYYKRMQATAPNLLATNVNHWFQNNAEKRMIRTLNGQARAFLSNRYRRIDNYEVLETVLPIIAEMGDGVQIVSTEITDSRLYLKFINPRLELEVSKNDIVQSGVTISNSEVGLGSIKVEPLVYRLVCTNGMISQDFTTKKYHVGRVAASEEAAYELFTDETLQADDKAFMLKIADTVRAAADLAKFTAIVDRMRSAKEQKIEGNPIKAVEIAAKTFALNQKESGSVLNHLISGGELSAYGMLNAITRTAQDAEDYDRATELERMGGQVLSLPASSWREIALAS